MNLGGESLADAKAQQGFAGFGVIPIDAQGNDPLCKDEGCNIASTCKMLLAVPT